MKAFFLWVSYKRIIFDIWKEQWIAAIFVLSRNCVDLLSLFSMPVTQFYKCHWVFREHLVQWRIQGGAPARPPLTKMFLLSCSFLGKPGKFVCWRPLLGESWIRPCRPPQVPYLWRFQSILNVKLFGSMFPFRDKRRQTTVSVMSHFRDPPVSTLH